MNLRIRTWRSLIALLLVLSLMCAPNPVLAANSAPAVKRALPEPDTALSLQIRTDYLAKISEGYPSYAQNHSVEDIILHYYGTYHTVSVVIVFSKDLAFTADMATLNIDGISFLLGSSTYLSHFFAYEDNTFYPLAAAFKKGLLTRQDLLSAQKTYYGSNDVPWLHPLSDVSVGAWYYDAVRYVTENKLMNGVGVDVFSPDGAMSRAMLVTVLWRAAGCPDVGGSPFADVPAGQWYSRAVAWAAQEHIINGVGDKKFAPNAPVTREQFATIAFRLSAEADISPAIGDSFADAAAVHGWADAAMRWAIHNNIIEGVSCADGRYLNPTAATTRAQAAAILMRLERPRQAACVNDLTRGYTTQHTQTPTLDETSANAIADFSVNLFRTARDSEKNSVTSPLSVLYALAMVANGAKGNTLAQLEQSFGMDISETNDALLALREALNDDFSELNIANSIWVKDGFSVKADFLQKNADYLQAAAFQAPFDASTVDAMNNWISRNTDGLIPKLLNSLPPEAVMTFINAILFKADWADPYTSTVERPFYRADGVVETGEMLPSSEHIYLHDDTSTGFLKPFMGGAYAFAVIVPNEGVSLESYIANMDGASLRQLLKGEHYDAVYTKMPKFHADFDADLTKVLPKLGITDALTTQADFSGIADDLYISDALHKAVIDVDEFGVSAAAVTVFTGCTTGIPERTATVVADRPYLYMIVNTETNLPLFIGANVTA